MQKQWLADPRIKNCGQANDARGVCLRLQEKIPAASLKVRTGAAALRALCDIRGRRAPQPHTLHRPRSAQVFLFLFRLICTHQDASERLFFFFFFEVRGELSSLERTAQLHGKAENNVKGALRICASRHLFKNKFHLFVLSETLWLQQHAELKMTRKWKSGFRFFFF